MSGGSSFRFNSANVKVLDDRDFWITEPISPASIMLKEIVDCMIILFYNNNTESNTICQIWQDAANQTPIPRFAAVDLLHPSSKNIRRAFIASYNHSLFQQFSVVYMPFVLVYTNRTPVRRYEPPQWSLQHLVDFSVGFACQNEDFNQASRRGQDSIGKETSSETFQVWNNQELSPDRSVLYVPATGTAPAPGSPAPRPLVAETTRNSRRQPDFNQLATPVRQSSPTRASTLANTPDQQLRRPVTGASPAPRPVVGTPANRIPAASPALQRLTSRRVSTPTNPVGQGSSTGRSSPLRNNRTGASASRSPIRSSSSAQQGGRGSPPFQPVSSRSTSSSRP